MKDTVALIGVGRWGRNILRDLSASADVAYLVHGGSQATADFLEGSYPNIAVATDYQVALKDPCVTSVFIATPIRTHADIVRDALTAGKHVFVEKPLSLDPMVVDELHDLAEARGLTLATGYVYRFDPSFRELVRRCEASTGLSVSFEWKKYGSFDSPLIDNLLVHELALAIELVGTGSLEVSTSAENFFEGRYNGPRGTAHIMIDRESQERSKTIAVEAGDTLLRHRIGRLVRVVHGEEEILAENPENILSIEIANFLNETRASVRDEKGRRIDHAIAAALAPLTA